MRSQNKSFRSSLMGDLSILSKTIKFTTPDGDAYEFSREELSDELQARIKKLKPGTRIKNLTFSVSTNGDVLYSFHPNSGTFLVRFSHFAHKPNELPSPRLQPGGERSWTKNGKTMSRYFEDRFVATAILSVVSDDEFDGMEVPFTLNYSFERDKSGEAYINDTPSKIKDWENLVDLSGGSYADLSIPYSSNVLPDIEPEIGGEVFQAQLERGFVKEIQPLPVGLKVKRPNKKSAAPAAPAASSKKPKKSADEIMDDLYGKPSRAKAPAAPAPAAATKRSSAKKESPAPEPEPASKKRSSAKKEAPAPEPEQKRSPKKGAKSGGEDIPF